jgi:ABC-2 type transport system ATP-binding protein
MSSKEEHMQQQQEAPTYNAPLIRQPIIKVENLVKRYKRAEKNAVDDISFTVAQGSLFALLGPNGAGKTTTISILTTTLQPTSGSVTIADYDVSKQSSAVRDNVGIIFQKPSLDLNLTAEENVRFHATLYGLYPFRPSYRLMPRSYRQQVENLAQILDINEDLFRPVKKFSGGMKRKLEILRSLLHSPRVLFLDEPTTGLDPSSRHSLWEYLRQVRTEHNTTIFLTTHYLEEAENAEDVCIINKGKIVAQGTPASVKAELIKDYVLIDADDRVTLHAELLRHEIPFEETSDASKPGPLRVLAQGKELHQILKMIETPLTRIETHTPSLEDAYLEIVGE